MRSAGRSSAIRVEPATASRRAAPGSPRSSASAERVAHDRGVGLDRVEHDRVEHALLAAVVAVHRAGRDADALGDLGQAHGGVAPAREQVGGDTEDRGLAIRRAPTRRLGGDGGGGAGVRR